MIETTRSFFVGSLLAFASLGAALGQTVGPDGVIRVRSAYPMDETIARIRADIAAKGILFFQAVDQSQLAAKAGISLRPSTLLEFGNPPLGAQFLTANPNAGLDWPVRLLVTQDESGAVWAPGPTSPGLPNATASPTARCSSTRPPAWFSPSPLRSRRSRSFGVFRQV